MAIYKPRSEFHKKPISLTPWSHTSRFQDRKKINFSCLSQKTKRHKKKTRKAISLEWKLDMNIFLKFSSGDANVQWSLRPTGLVPFWLKVDTWLSSIQWEYNRSLVECFWVGSSTLKSCTDKEAALLWDPMSGYDRALYLEYRHIRFGYNGI